MDAEKINEVMDAVAEKTIKECEANGSNTERILLLAQALNELASVRACVTKIKIKD